MSTIATILAVFLSLELSVDVRHLDADVIWVAQGQFCEPETVLPLPDDTLLVSNVCGFSKPGSGFLSHLDDNGAILNWRFVDQLDAPLGMVFLENVIYVIDRNRVKSFSWPKMTPIDVVPLTTRVANDLAVATDGTLYVTDSATHQVHEYAPDGTMSLVANDFVFKDANGIHLRGDQLFVGGQKLWCVDLKTNRVDTIEHELLADIDGIEFERDGTLQITPVGGPLIRYLNDGSFEVLSGDGISSANHGYSPALELAYIPTGFDNTVIAIRLPVSD